MAKTNQLIQHWQERLEDLQNLLSSVDGNPNRYRLDLNAGLVLFLDEANQPVAEATCRVVATFAIDSEHLLMAWGNPHLPDAATCEAVEGMKDSVFDLTKDEATQFAMVAAEKLKSSYFMPIHTQKNVVYLVLDEPAIGPEMGAVASLNGADESQSSSAEAAKLMDDILDIIQDAYGELKKKPADYARFGEELMNNGTELLEGGQTTYASLSWADEMVKTGENLIYAGRECLAVAQGDLPASKKEALLKMLENELERWFDLQAQEEDA